MKTYNRVYAKIDLDAIAFNLRSIEKKVGPQTQILAVVKTDGYGHGAVWTAREAEGFDSVFGFAVATAEEAFDLRSHGIKKPILILGYTFETDYEELARRQIRPAVCSYEMARQIAKAAQRTKTDVRIHLKIDTGMGRIGYQATPEAADEIAAIAALPGIVIEGVFTHFARADETDKAYTYDQMRQFDGMLRMLKERGVDPPFKHCANSAAIAEIREANFDLVRAGIILYGTYQNIRSRSYGKLWRNLSITGAKADCHDSGRIRRRLPQKSFQSRICADPWKKSADFRQDLYGSVYGGRDGHSKRQTVGCRNVIGMG